MEVLGREAEDMGWLCCSFGAGGLGFGVCYAEVLGREVEAVAAAGGVNCTVGVN